MMRKWTQEIRIPIEEDDELIHVSIFLVGGIVRRGHSGLGLGPCLLVFVALGILKEILLRKTRHYFRKIRFFLFNINITFEKGNLWSRDLMWYTFRLIHSRKKKAI